MANNTAIVTMKGELETVFKLSNGTTFNDLAVTPHFKVTIIFNVKYLD